MATLNSWVPLDTWDAYPAQKGAPLLLTAGQRVLLTAASCNSMGAGAIQVGLQLPGGAAK